MEQLQAQVIHYHDLAMKVAGAGGDAAGAHRSERPLQSLPATAKPLDPFEKAVGKFTARLEEAYKLGRAPGAIADANSVAVVPPPVVDGAASGSSPIGGAEDSSVPSPPAPHATPRRAVRSTSSAFDIHIGDYEEITGESETITRRVKEHE